MDLIRIASSWRLNQIKKIKIYDNVNDNVNASHIVTHSLTTVSPQSHTNHESHESLVTYRVTVAESLQRHSHESQS